jgi:D-methionine transport system ATP-binding protein
LGTLLELNNVSLTGTIAQQPILEALSLRVQAGEFVALLGPSGAGKSSLLRLINRLREPTSGQITFQGQPLSAIAPPVLRRQVMLVGQDSRLLGMTAMQALHYPLVLQKLPEAERQTRVTQCINLLQLPSEWLDKTEVELSGGQQQQVAIARALVNQPTVLLLDEPTSALDLGAATRILSMIRTQVQEQRLTVIMSNHQIDLAESFCDRVLYLEHGRLLHDQSAQSTDWKALRQTLLDADAKVREDWGDADENW